MAMFMCCHHDLVTAHSVHVINAEQHQIAANLWTKPTDLSHTPAYSRLENYINHRHLLLLSLKADSHFTIQLRAEYNVIITINMT